MTPKLAALFAMRPLRQLPISTTFGLIFLRPKSPPGYCENQSRLCLNSRELLTATWRVTTFSMIKTFPAQVMLGFGSRS
jgi:hypothetical protein